MKIVVPGGSGHVGSLLARALHADGHEVVVLSRTPRETPWRTIAWDARTPGPWVDAIDGADVVINLAGRSVNCRYTPAHRAAIRDSRVDSTRAVGAAISAAQNPPKVWLQASTATIYAHRYDAPHDEATGVLGGDEPGAPDTWRFSVDVARAWEEALALIPTPHTRKVALRAAMVMSPEPGGVFEAFLRLVRLGLGGPQGDGKQFVSWVHGADFLRAVRFLIEREEIDGPVNIAAPNPLSNREFLSALRQAWGAPVGIPAPAWLLEIGALVLRTETELILKSRRVVPGRLLDAGFTFDYPTWPAAAKALCDATRRRG